MSYIKNTKRILSTKNNRLKRLENITTKDLLEQEFYDREAEKFLDNFDPALFRYDPDEKFPLRTQYFYSLLQDIAGKRVLDICCGHGFTSVKCAKNGAQVNSIDISPKMIKLTRKNAAFNNVSEHITAEVMSAQEMSFPDNTFDYVTGLGALHHLNIQLAGREISRVVKNGGRVLFVEPRIPFGWLINLRSIIPVPCNESPGGAQLTDSEVREFSTFFSETRITYYIFLQKFARFPLICRFNDQLELMDQKLISRFPFLKKFCFAFVLDFTV